MKNIKRLYTSLEEMEYKNLMNRLENDRIKRSEIIKLLLDAYTNDDETIRKFINEYKIKKGLISKRRHATAARLETQRELYNRKYLLSKEDINQMYDIFDDEFLD